MRILFLLAVVTLGGCSNSITFYQATRSSLTVETSGVDVNKPVQGNFGYKTRTFILNPKMGDGKDVMALISDAQFNNVENSSGDDVITFRAALISGDAANNLSELDAVEAAAAVSMAKPIPTYSDLAKSSLKIMCDGLTASEFTQTGNLVTGTAYGDLTTAQMQQLESQTGAGISNYTEALHNELAQLLQRGGSCS
ncbi:hypothetical protein LJ739_11535 [Aestuariibacter halophilus]|uniref:Lipoprotein n=1 Tax=Fluctibacter halophilus TaxID=226011 RepID=A0ABS8GAN7_9ALTE|nr:hypothetical protein [Aestuariibacter halophilus]MCC2616875.1 hypothetical protein [Aestuariibacter halophilus]